MCLAWAQLGVSMITRSMLVLSAGLLAAVMPLAGPAQAQSIFLLDEDPASEQPSAPEVEAQTEAVSPTAESESTPSEPSIFMNTGPVNPAPYTPPVSQGNNSSAITAPEIGGGGRGAVSLTPEERFAMPPRSTEEILRPENFGLTTTEYNKRLADIEAQAVKNPDAAVNDPLFDVEMLRTGEKISQTYGRQIGERCAMPAYTISVLPGDWTPSARDGLQQQAMGKLSSALGSACNDQAKRQQIGNYAPMVMIQNIHGGGAPQMVFDGGVMMLRGDFSKSGEGVNQAGLQSQLDTALVQADKYMQPLMKEAEEFAGKYAD